MKTNIWKHQRWSLLPLIIPRYLWSMLQICIWDKCSLQEAISLYIPNDTHAHNRGYPFSLHPCIPSIKYKTFKPCHYKLLYQQHFNFDLFMHAMQEFSANLDRWTQVAFDSVGSFGLFIKHMFLNILIIR